MNSLLLGAIVTVAASQTPAQPPAADPSVPSAAAFESSVSQSPELSAPFRNLFAKAAEEARRREQTRAAREHLEATLAQPQPGVAAGKPKVVCGMVVTQADPNVDPAMIQRPAEPTTTMHIRKIPPPACAE